MKKTISILLPSLIILLSVILLRNDKNILIGIYFIFPIIFIAQGLIYTDLKKELIIGLVLSSIAFIIPINLLYNMGSCIQLLLVYIVLSILSFFVKKKVNCR